MAISGGCPCGGVRFEIVNAGPFEPCHCSRCRKRGGSAALAMVGVLARDDRLRIGRELTGGFRLRAHASAGPDRE